MSEMTNAFPYRKTVNIGFGMLIVLLYVFLMAPLVMIIGASFTKGLMIEFPPQGISFRWYAEFFNRQDLVDGLFMSLRIGAVTAVVTMTVAMMAAIAGRVLSGKLSGWFQLGMTLPLLVPELLTAVGLLFFLYKIQLAKTVLGLQMGHILMSFPYAYVSIAAAMRQVPQSLEEASQSLGATGLQTFRLVILPLVMPGLAMGGIFAFINSFDLYTISLLLKPLGGNTLPLALFDFLTYEFKPTAAAAATLSILLSIAGVALVQRLVGLQRAF
ncbi:putative spermidine/putrescine transport system permease protein [Rhodovulum sulfidophilum]|uniref:ABC transporter permease n=1 Tax=Rhodovulum sulfidophilum TaxID=35806 RepID=UPI0005A7B956|nr:ABC transporter permease [Rhodovulum sulfidophilum]ANB33920.1 ABC transporter permease [Rhodovulum sulfidophilum DSM 1374]ANB37742.1 ABC transporter permease [Rhodovulum sulfidophilum]MCW2304304.1 putative spermidine/putrescine transport system permease protein [Rhodovulum sulfidophilum]